MQTGNAATRDGDPARVPFAAHEKGQPPEERQADIQSIGQRCLAAQAKARNQFLIGGLVTSLDIIK